MKPPPPTASIEDNIIAELNKALQAMGAIKPDRAGKIDIIVSLDAQTLGLGYYIDPTIVTVDKYTQASYVITDLIKQTIKERDKMDLEGATVDHVSEPDVNPPYAYMMTGTEANSFYLAQVYWPDQSKAKVAEYIKRPRPAKLPRKVIRMANTSVSLTIAKSPAGCTPSRIA